MAIPKVKIAVEEPIQFNGSLLSNVGWGKDVTKKPESQALFDFEASAQGSISHRIYVKQVIGSMMNSTSRYAAENIPSDTPRYKNPKINSTMVAKLIAGTGQGEISVFPVGPDHLKLAYDENTLGAHLAIAEWELLENK